MQEPNYYSIIPANVRYSKKISPSEKLLYGEITSLSNKMGYCWAENSYFAELYKVAKETVSVWVSNLKNAGFIDTLTKKDQNTGKPTRIILIIHEELNPEEMSIPLEKTDTPLKENLNTTINNIKDNTPTSPKTLEEFKQEFNFIAIESYGGESEGMITKYSNPSRKTPFTEDEVIQKYNRYISNTDKKQQTIKKAKDTRAETVTLFSTNAISLLTKMQGIMRLDGAENHKHAQAVRKKIEFDMRERKMEVPEDDIGMVHQLQLLLERISRNEFHWKNLTSFAYFDKHFNKIIRDVL